MVFRFATFLTVASLLQVGIANAQIDPREDQLPAEVKQLKAELRKQKANAERLGVLEALKKQNEIRNQQLKLAERAELVRLQAFQQPVAQAPMVFFAGNPPIGRAGRRYGLRITKSNGHIRFGIASTNDVLARAALHEANRVALQKHFEESCSQQIKELEKVTQLEEKDREKLRLASNSMCCSALRWIEELKQEVDRADPGNGFSKF